MGEEQDQRNCFSSLPEEIQGHRNWFPSLAEKEQDQKNCSLSLAEEDQSHRNWFSSPQVSTNQIYGDDEVNEFRDDPETTNVCSCDIL